MEHAVLSRPRAEQMLGDGVVVEPHAPGEGLPLFVTARDSALRRDLGAALQWLSERRGELDALLPEVGAIVLRGFPVTDAGDFGRVIEPYPDMAFGYSAGATTRNPIAGRVFEATHAPPDFRIMLHQEMAYLPDYPSRLAFFCAEPPATGGETIIADVRRFEAAVPRRFMETVARRGVRYVRNFRAPDWLCEDPLIAALHKPWTAAFFTDDAGKAEADCLAMGLEFQWEANGSLSVIYAASGFATHAVTGREIWFNHIASQTMTPYNWGAERVAAFERSYGDRIAWPYATFFADGSPIPVEDVESLYPILEALTVAFPWRAGDVMLVDNLHTFHGRNPFTGKRNVQVALLG